MKLLPVEYLGTTAMDKRFSTPMLPWVITEIRRRGTIDKICLGVEDGSLQAYDTNFEQQFSHRIQHMLRFSRAVHDARSFMYLLKDPVRPLLHCHLFKAARPDDVTELFNQMRDQGGQQAGGYMPAAGACSPPPLRHLPPQRSLSSAANLTSLCADISPSSSHFFEVLYIGKIKVSHKKVPDTFIDDALGKFQVHEQEKLLKGKISLSQIKRGQFNNETRRGSQDSASDTGSTESIVIHSNNSTLTSPMTPIDPIASIASLNLPKNFNAQSSIDHPNDTNKYESDKNKSASLKRRQFSEEKYARGCTESSCADPTIKLERCDTFGTDAEMQIAEGRVRTISENNATVDNCIPSNLESSKSMSRSFENISMLDDSRGEEVKSVRLGVPIGPFIPNRKSGSIEALPTVAEDNPQTKDEPVRHDLRGRAASISGGSILRRQDSADHNRTMVFQVGRTDLRLISPDRKQILLHKQLKDVATCIQGLQNTEHFGFICREINVECFMGYIFKCQSDSVAVDVVQAITQAYTATAEGIKHREKPALVSCEHCPMVWYHKLCAEVDSQNDRKTQAIIFKRISFLDDEEQSTILTKFRGAETDSVREQNEFLMMLLRAHCEAKQSRHIHDTAENRSEFLNQYLGGSTIFMKAKRSLTNSFDHLLKRKGSRDDFGPQLREMNLPLSRETSPNTQTLETPSAGESDQISPMRSRASTLSSTNGDEKTPTILLTSEPSKEDKNQQLKSPMMDIFFKVGSSPKSPTRTQQMTSWRQEMFNKVVTPSKCEETNENKAGQKRSKEELRRLWKTAIHQALLLIRMEKENARLTARQEISAVKRIKLEYDEISHCPQDILQVWELLVSKESRISNKCDKQMLLQAIRQGVPRSKRGEVWHFLAHQFCLQQPPYDTTNFPNYNTPYETLLKQLTSHQHAILIDLGRTFPNHTYYSSPLGPGQLALFNLLKAYSLLDPEVGYCQGLSFVAGILLLHMPEDEAFFLLRHLMFRRGMRKQYLPDMEALQVHLYQLSRLLHDQAPEVYEHFNNHEVAPTLYAAPWILTIFASQFPLGFVTRVFDVLFLESPEVIFQVAVALLRYHKKGLMACESFEEIMDYLKNTIPAIDKKTMDIVLKELFTTDIKKSLNEYKVEYHVLQEEMASVRPQLDSLARLEHRNKQLMDQNQQLLEQLEIAMSNSQRLETTRSVHQSTINRLESQTRSLEVTVSTLGQFINSIIERKIDLEIPGEVRRIVSQIALSDRRRSATPKQNIGNIPNMKRLEPQRYMVKSLSMGKLGLNFNKTPVSDQVPRSNSVNVNLGTTLTQTLKQQDDSVRKNSLLSTMNENLSKIDTKGHKGFPLRVIDDNAIYEPIKSTPVKLVPKHPLKTALSQPILGAKSGFFANSHNHIQQQRMNSLALKQGLSDATATLMQSKIEEKLVSPKLIDTSNIPIEKSVSLPLEVKNSFQSDNLVKSDCKSDVSKDVSVDSGISTPMSPNSESTMCEIPLFDSDVTCTFNGTTKLKTIKSGVKCAKP